MTFLLATAMWGLLLFASPPEDPPAALERVLARSEFQRELPPLSDARLRPDGDPGGRGHPDERSRRLDRELERRSFGGALLEDLFPILKALFWILVAVAGVLLIAWLVHLLSRRGAHANVREFEPGALAGGAVDGEVAEPIGDPEELARQGRFGEAIHALLLLALTHLLARSSLATSLSLTSRELARSMRHSAAVGGALGELVTAVERSLFAGLETGEPEYLACAENFRQILHAEPGESA